MKIYLVGGAVRDELLNYPVYEHDYVVVGASPEQMLKQGFTPVGKDFPVFLHPETKDEYALARTERKSGHGYQGFTFNTDTSVTLEDDLIRRDLTINAIAKSETGEIFDPYNGQRDLKEKKLRHVSDAFREDPVRILRVARFSARYAHLDFSVAEETSELMQAMVENGEASHLVAERVWKEFSRALGERSPEVFISTLFHCGALAVVMPEINDLLKKYDNIMESPASRALTHARQHTDNTQIRLACLLHPLNENKSKLNSLNQHLGLPNEFKDLSRLVIEFYSTFIKADSSSTKDLLNLINKCDALRKPERFENFLQACQLCAQANNERSADKQKMLISHCFEKIKQISPQVFIQQGYQGKELGVALEKEKLNAIEKVISKEQNK